MAISADSVQAGRHFRRAMLEAIASGDAEVAGQAAAQCAHFYLARRALERAAVYEQHRSGPLMRLQVEGHEPHRPSRIGTPARLADAVAPAVRVLVADRLLADTAGDVIKRCEFCGQWSIHTLGGVALCYTCWQKVHRRYILAYQAWQSRKTRRRRATCPGYQAWREAVERPVMKDPKDETSPVCPNCGVRAICADGICGQCGVGLAKGWDSQRYYLRGSDGRRAMGDNEDGGLAQARVCPKGRRTRTKADR